jgi:hypothetical protein
VLQGAAGACGGRAPSHLGTRAHLTSSPLPVRRPGYHWDERTGLYYHQSSRQWLRLDPATGQFAPAAAAGSSGTAAPVAGPQPQPQPQQEQQQPPPQQQQQQQQHAPAAAPQPEAAGPAPAAAAAGPAPAPAAAAAAAAAPRRGAATIGAAPQLNAQNLLMKVAVEEVG